jgi:hypothetical protein
VKTKNRENGCQCYLTEQNLFQFFKKCDNELAEKCRHVGCQHCPGVLHRSDYKRKPRGGPPSDQPPPDVYRDSFCCDQEGCRKRHTPPSIRFLGRKVYWAVVVILTTALQHGINDRRLQVLRGHLEIDRRTLERWRRWWLDTFVKSEFWKSARARFTPPLCEATLPLSLCEAFGIDREDQLLKLLHFLGPVTTPSLPWSRAF